jgi:hypothetical protein
LFWFNVWCHGASGTTPLGSFAVARSPRWACAKGRAGGGGRRAAWRAGWSVANVKLGLCAPALPRPPPPALRPVGTRGLRSVAPPPLPSLSYPSLSRRPWREPASPPRPPPSVAAVAAALRAAARRLAVRNGTCYRRFHAERRVAPRPSAYRPGLTGATQGECFGRWS